MSRTDKNIDRWGGPCQFIRHPSQHQETSRTLKYYAVVYEGPAHAGDNWSAYVPDLPGLAVTGASRAECEALMAEGIPFHVEGLVENGDPVPPPTAEVGYLPEPGLLAVA